MIFDYELADVPADIQADICIIGAGFAGITLALELAAAGRSVTLLEAGGMVIRRESQEFYEGDSVGREYYPLASARVRVFGGTSAHWSGWCGPLDEMDFQNRAWIPHSGWPVSRSDLDDHYRKAHRYLDLGPYEYGHDYWSDEYPGFPDIDEDNVVIRHLQFSRPPKRFGRAYRQEIAASERILLYIQANVTRLNLSANGREIESVDLRTTTGKQGKATAATYVIACGGIENARLMLASNDVNRRGVGNDNDLVGRFFMEHLEAPCASVYGSDVPLMRKLVSLDSPSGTYLGTVFCASPAMQRSQQIANGGAFVDYPRIYGRDGWRAFRTFVDAFRKGRLPENAATALSTFFRDFDSFAGRGALRLRGANFGREGFVDKGVIKLFSQSEQVPNPDSRVVLSDRRDPLGNRLADLDWRLTELDRRTIRQSMLLIGAEINRSGAGRFRLDEWLRSESGTEWSPHLHGGFHHIGTTRMSASAADGVVDKDCRVHGIANLHVAGSSVFPTGGRVNPTLTIVALAARLAQHLAGRS